MSAPGEIARNRRAQIVNLSFAELMLLLVFMTITFSFLAKEEGLREIPLIQRELDEAYTKITNLEKQISELQIEHTKTLQDLARLKKYLDDLGIDSNTLRPKHSATTDIDSMSPGQLKGFARNQQAIAAELQGQNAKLRKDIAGGKAPGLPICLVTSRYLLSFSLLADGSVLGKPAWDTDANQIAKDLPGVSTLTSSSPISLKEFLNGASKLGAWGKSQSQPCTFTIGTRRLTNDAAMYDEQLNAMGKYFYVGKIR